MKKNLLALAALGASVALLAGCGATTPEVPEETGTVVEETIPTPEVAPTTDTGVITDTTTETPAPTPAQ
ncbi:MAG: hypothetical protein WC875_02725 [Candidatus Absconditabacterales bacterium]|jgi:hypothetical protein